MPTSPIHEVLSELMRLTRGLNQVCPIGYLTRMQAATTAEAFYAEALRLGYAVNAKELRDTGDERVHHWCNLIWRHMKEVRSHLTLILFPHSPEQKADWLDSLLTSPGGKFAFRDDGSLHVDLVHASLDGSTLHIGRLWTHVGGVNDPLESYAIRLNPVQCADVAERLRRASSMQDWIDLELHYPPAD
ncbi:hypothetical protein C9I28_08790 [Pseudoduganella armeniaca]|uniref:Uncharacterized protein n=2 Tax=Pseudoduganella armeniaca TaxID=2072590 RepID=A0A2R4C8E2_9BURK|nr:hypothetical protein C9I28_08790 [Pseudoduganella armeniaca]